MKTSIAANLDDVGSEVVARIDPNASLENAIITRKVQMVIVAPRGKLVIFDIDYYILDTQCEGIKAFMEEHRND